MPVRLHDPTVADEKFNGAVIRQVHFGCHDCHRVMLLVVHPQTIQQLRTDLTLPAVRVHRDPVNLHCCPVPSPQHEGQHVGVLGCDE